MARKSVSTTLGSFSFNRSIVSLLIASFAAAMIIVLGATDSAETVRAHDPSHTDTHADICAALITGFFQDTLRSECEILLDVKDTLRGTAPLNWGDDDVEFAQWDGITAPGNIVVTEIVLSGLGLNGEIPPELGGLTALAVLNLWNNELTGTIPTQLGDLTSLITLSLSENRLTGSIPSTLGNLTNVQNLYLRTNRLSGTIPSQLGSMTNLRELSLSQNQLTGTIPSELGSLSSRLTHLYLNENQLSGAIPSELGDLTDMVVLNLSHNQLTGEIPTELGGLGRGRNSNGTYNNEYNLINLNLGHNKLSGSVPNELTTQTVQTHLYLNDNQLSGNLERDLSGLSNMIALTHLHLDQNQFEGYVPAALGDIAAPGNFTTLKELTLHGNDFAALTYDSTWPRLNDMTGLRYLTLDEYLIPNGNDITFINPDFPEFTSTINADPLGLGFDTTVGTVTRSTKVYLELPDDPTPAYADADGTYVTWRYDPDAEYAAVTLPSGATLVSEPYFEIAVHFLDDTGSPIVGARLSEPVTVCLEHDQGLESPRLFGLAADSSMWKLLPTGNPTGFFSAVYYVCGETRYPSTFVVGSSTSEPPTEEAVVVQPAKRVITSDGETFRAVVDDQSIVLAVPPRAVTPDQPIEFTIQKAEAQSPRGFLVPGDPDIIDISLASGDELNFPIMVCMEPVDGLSGEQYLLHLGDGADSWILLFKPLSNPPGYEDWVCGHTSDFSLFTVGVIDPATVGHVTRISRIEPSIRSVTLSPDDVVRLSFDIYGRQDILDNALGEGHDFLWDDDGAGGDFQSADRGNEIIYTAPTTPGRHIVTVTSPDGACQSGEDEAVDRCTARFTITVRRPSAAPEERPAPENPIGGIPQVLVDAEGRQYEVFTPEEGGLFDSGDVTISAEPGVVPNLEVLGVRVDIAGAASNVGMSHHRYSLAGMWHEIRAIDADEAAVSGYVLESPLEVCLPLPDVLRSNISDVAVVSANADGSLTILSSSVRIMDSGTSVCGGLSELPASVAVGRLGSPADLPTPTPSADETGLPDTGGFAPSGNVLVLVLLMGLSVLLLVVFGTRMQRMR